MFETENLEESALFAGETESNEECSSVNAGYRGELTFCAAVSRERYASPFSETGTSRARPELGRRTVSPHRPWP